MIHLIIGVGGLLLFFVGLIAFVASAAGEDAGTVLAIVLGSVAISAIVAFFAVQLSVGLSEVFSLNYNE